jgi:hypothetical protein
VEIGTGGEIIPGGIFAQPSNKGNFGRMAFAAVIETGARAGFRISRNVEIYAGYNFLFTSSVVRPGDQINPSINPSRTALAQASRQTVGTGSGDPIPFGAPGKAPPPTGPREPAFSFAATNFWAQGLTAGVRIDF